MLKIKCDFCPKELDDLGALIFGPPTESRVRKLHMCRDCYHKFMELYQVPKLENPDIKDLNKLRICNSGVKKCKKKSDTLCSDTSFC